MGWGGNQGRGSHRPPLSPRDRKKKRFVGQTGQEDKKKVRTESGRYISSSYKNNLYPACLRRGEGWGRAWTRQQPCAIMPCSWGSIPCRGRGLGRNPGWSP